MINITGTVGSSGKYLVSGIPTESHATIPLKIVFENRTAGTNLGLFAGTAADFESSSGGTELVDSGGPGFQFLSIIDAVQLKGKVLFVRREVGNVEAQFSLSIE
jgi:hypothetical protein